MYLLHTLKYVGKDGNWHWTQDPDYMIKIAWTKRVQT